MRAIGNWVIIEDMTPKVKKTTGGLELTEDHTDDIRYKTGKVISSGNPQLDSGEIVVYDKVAGHLLPNGKYRCIGLRDIVAVE